MVEGKTMEKTPREEVPRRFFDDLEGWLGQLDAKNAALSARIEALCAEYPSAGRLQGELAKIEGSDQRFAARLRAWSWAESFGALLGEWRERLSAENGGDRQAVWGWSEARQRFVVTGEGGDFRGSSSTCAELIEALVVEAGEVSYPIIFNHDVEVNHRAVARAAAMSLSKLAALRAGEEVGGASVAFEEDAASGEAREVVPERELVRQIEDFVTTDPRAHEQRWVTRRARGAVEERELREAGGARVRLVVERAHLRVRRIEQARSEVVRKRHHVFVDPAPEQVHDRYFASETALDEAVESWLRARIEAGFRVFEERVAEA
ncbi:hypothetical protein FRC98_05845 [Lujinxingia vulgaris]|uniref:Uncharacterized protein n=1 Tax=Lujinxingia vulgaris TaxID=2600176 RepID=A0A5C6XF19_9DELT|nr:hypothetical protein [Lujinxingia vulgaris]TXD38409.1 hypothetical protein FRC98_05845 [Lujinxingia vulgaris]